MPVLQVRLQNDLIKIRLTLQINLYPKCFIKTPRWAYLYRLLPISQVPQSHWLSFTPVSNIVSGLHHVASSYRRMCLEECFYTQVTQQPHKQN